MSHWLPRIKQLLLAWFEFDADRIVTDCEEKMDGEYNMVSLQALKQQVEAQKTAVPALYGNIDFSQTPERFCTEPDIKTMLPGRVSGQYRPALLADKERVERARLYTLLGDTVCDRYAALMHDGYSMGELIKLLHDACRNGVENVEGAPQELQDFIHSMEEVPDWIDMKLVEEGMRFSRIFMATLTPFAIRGAFIATFMNKYSGLPMALTGALSKKDSGKQRINETASFFTAATLPGALNRDGAGFMAAAMVRLMHSIVRFNLLHHSDQWDTATYGIPVPQVDQMPAGTMPAFLNAFQVIRSGGTRFNHRQRAIAELCRYQSYLLGLPEDLLPASPQGIFDRMITYAGTLRDGYDDATCGRLVRSTMSAYRPNDKRLPSRLYNRIETSFSKVFFRRVFLQGGDKYKASMMGVEPTPLDYAIFAAANSVIMPQLTAQLFLLKVPVLGDFADKVLIRQIKQLLKFYGHAEYITDVNHYNEGDRKPIFNRRAKDKRKQKKKSIAVA